MGRTGEAPKSLRQSSVLHKVLLQMMLVVTVHPLDCTALYTEWTHEDCTKRLQLEPC